MSHASHLATAPLTRSAAARPRRPHRPGLAARGATLARALFMPGAAAEILREIGDVPPRDAASDRV